MLTALLAVPVLALSPLLGDGDLHPTLEEIFRPPRLLGVEPTSAALSSDGAWLTYAWTDQDAEEPERHLWLVRTSDGETRRLFDAADKVRVWWLPEAPRLLVQRDGWLEVLDPATGEPARPLLEVAGSASRLTFAGDESNAFLFRSGSDQDLWWVDPDSGRRRRLATGLTRRSSWFQVLEEAGTVALFAAPDGEGQEDPPPPRLLSLRTFDDRPVEVPEIEEGDRVQISPQGRWLLRTGRDSDTNHELIMADYLTDKVSTVPVRNSLAGDPANRVNLSVTSLVTGQTFEPPLDAQDRFHLRGITWSPDGDRVLLQRISGDHHVRQVLVLDLERQSVWPVFVERDAAWIGGPTQAAGFSPDGDHVWFTSEQSGFNHLYRVATSGGEAVAWTSGNHEVQRVQKVGEGDRLLLTTNETDPAEKHLVLLDVATGDHRRLTERAGCVSRAVLSADGTHVAYRQEVLGVPAELYVQPLDGSTPPRALTDTIPDAFLAQEFVRPEIVEYQNPDDGVTVRALLYRPQPFDPERTYPAVVFVHGAGYLQNVTRSMTNYEVNYLFHQRLARKGYVVLDADYRHSAGYGRDFRTGVYGFMGGKDLDDVVAGVDYLAELGYVDRERVGLYGGSYGGFLTLMALFTKPDVFACGAALRSVTDWRTYNAWYTNPRLGDPKENAEAYRRSSPIDHAEGLQKPLLLLHGLKDSNVFAQDTVRLIEKLIQLGKDFDAMLYPSQSHGFTDPESWIDEYKRIERFFDRYLQGAEERTTRAF